MAEHWDEFCSRLQDAGYTRKDLEYCSEDLFLTIAEETGAFTPLQISSLLGFWQRQRRTAARAETSVRPAASYPTLVIRQTAERLLERVWGGAARGGGGPGPSVRDVIGVEAPLSCWHAFHQRVAEQQDAGLRGRPKEAAVTPASNSIALLWKLCSPATLERIQQACLTSSPLAVTSNDDPDTLCESGVVLYDAALATTLGSNARTRVALQQRAAHDGWALVAFDVAVGRTRSVSAEEVGNLRHFRMEQCREMIREAGYDALAVPAVGAYVLCDPTQLVPRNVVYVDVPAGPTAGSAAAASNLSHSRRLEYSAGDDEGSLGGAHVQPPQWGANRTTHQSVAPVPAVHHSHANSTLSAPGGPRPVVRVDVSAEDTASVSATATAAAVRATRCEVHSQKEVEFWSPTEKRLLCSHCLYYDGHSRETCEPIEVAARREVSRLERWVANATTFDTEVQGVVQLFADAAADVARQEEKVVLDTKRQFERLREQLAALEADTLHDVRERSRADRQGIEASRKAVVETVERVRGLLADVDAPLRLYRAGGGATGVGTCVQLLRGVQRAFSQWPPVDIPPYAVVRPLSGLLTEAEAAIGRVPKVAVEPGHVNLPEAIDVNFLRTDCE